MWKQFFRDYLSFTRRQRIGIYILLSIILFCIIVSFYLPRLVSNEKQDKTEFRKAVAAFLAKQKAAQEVDSSYKLFYFDPNTLSVDDWQKLGISKQVATVIQHYLDAGGQFNQKTDLKGIYGLSEKDYQRIAPYVRIQQEKKKKVSTSVKEIHLFSFNPNKLSVKGWKRLGISENVALIIRHYLQAGGHFYKKEDLKTIYGISKKDYHRLETYIRIPKIKKDSADAIKKSNQKWTVSVSKLDINAADSAEWSMLYGIGPYFSSQIVNFREALGGFYKIQQIAEVYNLPDSLFQSIKSHLRISKGKLRKININKATFKVLNAHPYINYSQAKAIVAYRKQHDKFDRISELKNIQLFNNEEYQRLKPYLVIE